MASLSNFLFLCFLLCPVVFLQNPTCKIDSTPFSTQSPVPSYHNYTVSLQDEVINGVNYGRLISVGSRIWLMGVPFKISPSYTATLKNPCPQGWMLPGSQDLSNLISVVGANPTEVLLNPSMFNMKKNYYYLSSTKTYPTMNSYSLSSSWVFNGIKFLTSGTPQLAPINTYFLSTSIYGFCVLQKSNETTQGNSAIVFKGIDEKDLLKGLMYILSINNTNVIDQSWNLDGQVSNTDYLELIPMKEGSFNLNYKVTFFDGSVIGDCKTIWVRNYTGSNAVTNFTLDSLNTVTYPYYKYRNLGLHFNSGSAPMAPKDDGGAYIMYVEQQTMFLHVMTVDSNGQNAVDYNLTIQGYPYDIISVGWGWVALIQDNANRNYLYLLGVNTNNVVVFKRTLMNAQSSTPTNYTSDQVIFFGDSHGTPVFGMNAMFEPSSGRLSFGKNRIAVHFAHYNFFGYLSDGTRDDHTGDTLITVNLTGGDEKLAFSWGSSHSLTQTLLYNGDTFISGALGDAYPMNIFLASIDGLDSKSIADPTTGLYNLLNFEYTASLLPDIITGNGIGFANGRLGNILELSDGETLVLSYARRKSTANFDGQSYSSTMDELGLTFFNKDLTLIKDVPLAQGYYVNQVKSCRYGKYIFLSYVQSSHILNIGFLDPELNSDDVQYYMLIDEDGTVITGPLLMNSFESNMPASDEFRTMADGRCAWTVVDSNGYLNYVYLTPPEQTPTNYQLVSSSQFYNNQTFYLVSQFDLNQYSMAKVNAANQTSTSFLEILGNKEMVDININSTKTEKHNAKRSISKHEHETNQTNTTFVEVEEGEMMDIMGSLSRGKHSAKRKLREVSNMIDLIENEMKGKGQFRRKLRRSLSS